MARTINRYTNQEVVTSKEPAPLLIYKRCVGLYAVINPTTLGIALLQLHNSLVEGYGTQHRLATVPNEEYLGGGLRLDILPNEEFKSIITHQLRGATIQLSLLGIVAVTTPQVAGCTHRFGHHIHRLAIHQLYPIKSTHITKILKFHKHNQF
jgi:hypothetical protein